MPYLMGLLAFVGLLVTFKGGHSPNQAFNMLLALSVASISTIIIKIFLPKSFGLVSSIGLLLGTVVFGVISALCFRRIHPDKSAKITTVCLGLWCFLTICAIIYGHKSDIWELFLVFIFASISCYFMRNLDFVF